MFRESRTAKEAARALGTETGSVYGLIKRMHAGGILNADSDPHPPTRGTQYSLTEEARTVLDQVLEHSLDEQQEPGQLEDDQRLLIVEGDEQNKFYEVLLDPALSAAVSWGTDLGRSWLLAMTPEADGFARDKLVAALEEGGYRCERARVDGLLTGTRLRERAKGLLEPAKAFR